MLCNNADARRCSYFELGSPVVSGQDRARSSWLFGLFRLFHEMRPDYFMISWDHFEFPLWFTPGINTGSPSSKYEHRRASALLRNIQNIRIYMGKNLVSEKYENERISIKNRLLYLKCVLRLSCVVHGPIYGRFMGFYVNDFLST